MNLQTSSSRSSEEHTKIECKNKSITDRNNYILCKECGRFYFGSCNIHTIPVNNKSTNAVASNKSIVSLPDSLEIKKSSIPNAGLGVFAKTKLAIGVNFGPYQGKKVLPHDSVDSHDSRYTWEIIKDGEVAYYIDGKDECHANWMRYINCSRYEAEQNLAAYQYHNQVYHCTYKEVNNGEELLVWYGNCYADHLGINIEQTKELLRTKDEKNLNKITDKNQKRSIDTKQSPFHDTKRIIGNSLERSEEEEKKTPVSKNILPTSNEHKINSKLEDNQPISSLNLSIDEEAIIERYPKRSKRINYREEDNNDSYAYTKRIIENSLECSEEEKKTPVSKNILPTATEQINSKLEDNQPISSLDLSIAEGAIIERYPKRSKRINYREEHNTDSYTYTKRLIGNSLECSEEEKKTPVSKNILPTSNEQINSKLEDNQPNSSLYLSNDEEAIIERYPKRSKRINYREEDNNDSYNYTKRIIENSLECSEGEKKTPVSINKMEFFYNVRIGDLYCPFEPCTWTFFTAFELADHIKDDCHYGKYNGKVPCTHCAAEYKADDLKIHWRSKHKVNIRLLHSLTHDTAAECPNYLCSEIFQPSFKECMRYLKHSIICHPLYVCVTCMSEYNSSGSLRNHNCDGTVKREIRKSISKKEITVDRVVSNRPKLSRTKELELIKRWKVEFKNGKFCCPVPLCNKVFFVPNHYIKHLKNESKFDNIFEKIDAVECPYCLSRVQLFVFHRHMQNNHRDIANMLNQLKIGSVLPCPNVLCKSMFTSTSGLDYVKHAINCRPLYICNQCENHFKTSKFYEHHTQKCKKGSPSEDTFKDQRNHRKINHVNAYHATTNQFLLLI